MPCGLLPMSASVAAWRRLAERFLNLGLCYIEHDNRTCWESSQFLDIVFDLIVKAIPM